jgi:glycosyltransferase involved in cell wall biosynthesis
MTEKKITIAQLWSRYDGKAFARPDTILGLDPERFRTICIYLKKSSDKKNFFEERGYKTFYISKKHFFRMFNFWAVWKLAKILKEEQVDIIQCYKHQSTVYGTAAAMIAKTPVIFAHVEGLGRTRNIKRKLVNSFVLKRVNKVLAVADRVKEDVLEHNPVLSRDKVFTLGNSIDFKRFSEVSIPKKQVREEENFPVSSFLFGTIGRLVPTKGQEYLIRAFAKVKREIPNAYLVFIGDGRLQASLKSEAAEINIIDSIRFLGRREDVPRLLKAMDCFVLPSVAEGLPTVILEAMAAGVPCIASAVGGIPEIITNNETGFLVPAKNERALADAMIAVAKKLQRQITDIVNKAKNLVRTSYTHEEIRKKLEYLYETELQSLTNVKI